MRTSNHFNVFCILCGCLYPLSIHLTVAQEAPETPTVAVYKDSTRPVGHRVYDLLSRMTLAEKVAQLNSIWQSKGMIMDDQGRFDPLKAADYMPHGIGQIARPSDRMGQIDADGKPRRGARETAEFVNAVQSWVRGHTRLGIPVLFHEEGLHGYQAKDATVFPQAIGLASTWDPELIEDVYALVAREIRSRGAHLVLSPVVDVARDPRWGRIEETFGEDPFLVSVLGLAAVRGFQGDSLPLSEGRVLATLKHMTGHGQPESGMNIAPAHITERVLREVFLPPFEWAVREGNVQSVMASYNEIDGVPSHINEYLLKTVLRDQWGFNGFVVADYDGIGDLVKRHHVAVDISDAALQALRAGVDVDLPDGRHYRLLEEWVREEIITVAEIEEAVLPHLRAKFLAGLFENPFADPDHAEIITGNEDARALALKAAEKAIILLKNQGDILPLNPDHIRTLAVIGPNAARTVLGGYSDIPKQTVSILDGIRNRVGDKVEVLYAEGVRLTEGGDWWSDTVVLADQEENLARIRYSQQIAQRADLVVLVVGGNEQTSREAWSDTHLGDRADLGLIGQQKELVEAVLKTGVPVVAVLIHGRPLAVVNLVEGVDAVLDGWYLGQEEGTAVARALFGDINPGGKLPVTIPRHVGQLPLYYNHKPSARRGYAFSSTEPMFPFGFGLSYTTFEMSAPELTRKVMTPDESIHVEVELRNTGSRAGDEVVQMYIRDRVSSVTRPIKELKAFQRVHLAPGETRQVRFEINESALAFYNQTMEYGVEPGEFEVMIGNNSVDLQSVEFRVIETSPEGPVQYE